MAKAIQRVVIAVIRKESIVERSSSALRDRFYNACWVYSTVYIVYRTRSWKARCSIRVVRVVGVGVRGLFVCYDPVLGAIY